MSRKKFLLSFGVLMLSITALFTVVNKSFVHAQAVTPVISGYLWSDKIGWISTNCENNNTCSASNYKVSFNSGSGLLSGYAWNDMLEWITFDSANLSGCPSGTCTATMSIATGALTGWARACIVFQSGCSGALRASNELGGFDGWISLSGSGYQLSAAFTPSAWPSNPSTTNTGYAWGGDLINWIQGHIYQGAPSDFAPVINLSASSTSITSGQSTTLTWTVSGDADGNCPKTATTTSTTWTGDVTCNGSMVVSPNATTTYEMSASNTISTRSRTVKVIVLPATPSILLDVSNTRPTAGSSVTLTWTVSGDTDGTCDTSLIGTAVSGWTATKSCANNTPTTFTFTAGAVGASTTFTLSGTNGFGTTSKSITVTVVAAGSGTPVSDFTLRNSNNIKIAIPAATPPATPAPTTSSVTTLQAISRNGYTTSVEYSGVVVKNSNTGAVLSGAIASFSPSATSTFTSGQYGPVDMTITVPGTTPAKVISQSRRATPCKPLTIMPRETKIMPTPNT